MFGALKNRNFRLFVIGQSISLVGTWMQQLATNWLVYQLTHSTLWLGISVFSSQIPVFAFGLFSGVLVDRMNRKKLLLWTQGLSAIQAALLAALAFSGRIHALELIGLNLILGIINVFDMPGRQSFVIQLVEKKKHLPNAIALNSSVMNGTRLIGPALAGATIAVMGEAMCFLLNAVSYLAVMAALLMIRVKPLKHPVSPLPVFQSLKNGLHSAFRDPTIRTILILFLLISFFGSPYTTLFPALATRIPGGGADTLGAITAAMGCGALVGALYLAKHRDPTQLGNVMGMSGLTFAVGLIFLSQAQSFPGVLLSVFMTGLGMLLQTATGNTVVQTIVEDDKRGRVMSFYIFSILGLAPFGSLAVGSLAQHFGLKATFLIQGILCCFCAFLFLRSAAKINRQLSLSLREASSIEIA